MTKPTAPQHRTPLPELLAPAGGPDAGFAAFAYGADAVYLGLGRFSARADADNFGLDDVAVLTGYAHGCDRPRKVYVALNTVIRDAELPDALHALAALEEFGVDGIIVQDLGLCRLIRDRFPGLAVHASTQMAIHSAAGARQTARLGVRRVVAARELTPDEIADMAAPGAPEVEVFIHGALCYAYSGLCLLSSHLRGLSGNRGECAYICRYGFRCGGDDAYTSPMSMKDLALPRHVRALAATGADSLKIEGRKKSALYVAAVVNLYRKILDGTLEPGEGEDLEHDVKTIFSRPWTSLYMGDGGETVTDADTVGHRGAPLGRVEQVVPGTPDRLRIVLSFAGLERYDGIQIDLDERDKPFGFGVEEIGLLGRRGMASVFEAPQGSTVEVPLPSTHPAIAPGTLVQLGSSQRVKRSYRWDVPRPTECRKRLPVRFAVTIGPDSIRATGEITHPVAFRAAKVKHVAESFPEARSPEGTVEAVRKAFSRLGDTPFAAEEIRVDNPESRFVPASVLNEIRRDLAEALETERAAVHARRVDEAVRSLPPATPSAATDGDCRLRAVLTDRPECLEGLSAEDLDGIEDIILAPDVVRMEAFCEETARLAERLGADRLRISLPAVVRSREEETLLAGLEALAALGIRRRQVANPAGLTYLGIDPSCTVPSDMDVTADWPLYALNRGAGAELLDIGFRHFTLSPEDDRLNIDTMLRVFGPQAVLPVYQDTPLAISENPIFAPGDAPAPGELRALRGRRGEGLLAVGGKGRTWIIDERPYCLSGHLSLLPQGVTIALRADFSGRPYDATEVRDILKKIRGDEHVPGTHPANFLRGLSGNALRAN